MNRNSAAAAGCVRASRLFLSLLVLVTAARSARADANPDGSYTVPLYHNTDSQGKQNFLIYVSINDSFFNPYLFDTGSPGMLSSYGVWWPGTTPPTNSTPPGTGNITFSSGLTYTYNLASANITLGTLGQHPIVGTSSPVNLAQIITAGNLTAKQTYDAWAAAVEGGQYPLPENDFGNFGGGLFGNSTFGTVLAQLPVGPGLSRGFVVQSGGIGAATGSVLIGLSNATIAEFPIQLAMNTSGKTLPGGATGYAEAQVANTTVSLSGNSTTYSAVIPTVFDTGGGNNNIFYNPQTGPDTVPSSLIQGGNISGPLNNDTQFDLSYPGVGNFFSYLTGGVPAVNQMVIDENVGNSGVTRINPGISLFYQYDVMFDLDHGIIGLRPAVVPEPSAYALLGGTMALAAAWWRRRKHR